MHKIPE
jgi:hypothetical protein